MNVHDCKFPNGDEIPRFTCPGCNWRWKFNREVRRWFRAFD